MLQGSQKEKNGKNVHTAKRRSYWCNDCGHYHDDDHYKIQIPIPVYVSSKQIEIEKDMTKLISKYLYRKYKKI